jgi:hypothetical protein
MFNPIPAEIRHFDQAGVVVNPGKMSKLRPDKSGLRGFDLYKLPQTIARKIAKKGILLFF